MGITEVTRQTQDYAAALDAVAPGRLTGLYLVGSAALGDWQDKVSNVDVVAVADGWDEASIDAATGVRGPLEEGGGPCRLAFVTFAQLAVTPEASGPICAEGARRTDPEEFANPLTWRILAEEGICVRGPEYFTVHLEEAELRRWAAARLAGRWSRWLAHAGKVPGQLWRRRALAEDLLEVTRLHVAATRGQAVSKLRSGTMVLDDVAGHFSRVVTDAVGYRKGSRTSMYWGPVERKHHALELIGELTSRASEHPDG